MQVDLSCGANVKYTIVSYSEIWVTESFPPSKKAPQTSVVLLNPLTLTSSQCKVILGILYYMIILQALVY